MTHRGNRLALGILEVFVALTAVQGAIFVVPNLPPAWLKPMLGAALSIVAGVMMMAFELVEIRLFFAEGATAVRRLGNAWVGGD